MRIGPRTEHTVHTYSTHNKHPVCFSSTSRTWQIHACVKHELAPTVFVQSLNQVKSANSENTWGKKTWWLIGSWGLRDITYRNRNSVREACLSGVFQETRNTKDMNLPAAWIQFIQQCIERTDRHKDIWPSTGPFPFSSCCQSSSGPKAQWLTPQSNATQTRW